jgi:predicted Zn finger-like uncharacterized protein
MSLATRCTSCGTIFRVVQDQLKVSEGWVRCGRCQEVFNALQNLFDLDRESPPPWPPAPAQPQAASDDAGAWDSTQQPVAESEVFPLDEEADEAGLTRQPLLHTASREQVQAAEASTRGEEAGEDSVSGFADARFNVALIDDETVETPATAALAALHEAPSPSDAPVLFLEQADRQARWNRPGVRRALFAASAVAALALVLQAAFHWRSTLVAQVPESRAVFEPACRLLGCRLEPPRHLDSLLVDASGLTRLGPPGQYKVTLVLRNHSSAPVLLPSVELTLTDPQGQLLVRKALTPAELGARQDSIAAGASVPLQALLATGELRVVGYTVEIFYP